MTWDRLATVGVPIAAGAMTAAVLLGPAEERPAMGARVYGHLAAGTRTCAFRIETLEHLSGARQATRVSALEVVVRDAAGQPLCEWRGDTADDGLAETSASMRRRAVAGEVLTLTVRIGTRTLADGSTTVGPRGETVNPPSWSIPGPPAVTVTLPRGHVVPELAEQVLVEVQAARERPSVKVETTGAEHDEARARRIACDGERCQWAATTTVIARAPAVRLAVDVEADGASSHWEGDLPLVPSGAWLDRPALAEGVFRIRSATPREKVFVSKYNATGRVWGTAIAMTTDDRGFSHGEIVLPGGVDDAVLTYRLSSEPSEPPEATIGWPGLRMESIGGVAMSELADGLPDAIAAEKERMAETRLPAFGLILAAGLFEILYLLRRHRKQGQALDEHLQQQLKTTPVGIRATTPIAWVTFLSAILLLAFFILAAVAFWA